MIISPKPADCFLAISCLFLVSDNILTDIIIKSAFSNISDIVDAINSLLNWNVLLRQDILEPPEDDVSMAAHLVALQRECKKSSPSSIVIEEKMTRTLSHRSKMVQEKRVSEVLDTYPCLRIEKEVKFSLIKLQKSLLMVLGDNWKLDYLTITVTKLIFNSSNEFVL